jgi:hypothetical protein
MPLIADRPLDNWDCQAAARGFASMICWPWTSENRTALQR